LGLFITFEGGEGSGKSFQSKVLHRRLIKSGITSVLTFEPGGTELGNAIRRLLKNDHKMHIMPEVEVFLFSACRFQLLTEVIRPALERGDVVICDRFIDSTLAYQGYGRGIDINVINSINEIATGGLKPDLSILLDIPAQIGLNRKRRKNKDRFEQTGLDFHNKVKDAYTRLAEAAPARWLVIDALLSKSRISNIIWQIVDRLLSSRQFIEK
jgi:dTMP kinase